jgi:hypothetical protein
MPLKAWMFVLCFCVVLCCPVQVEAFATGSLLVKRSPTECLNRLRNLRCEAAKVLTRTVEPLMMMMMMMILILNSYSTKCDLHHFTSQSLNCCTVCS